MADALWLMFQMGGIGPMIHTRLGEAEWLAGDYSIADIANWCWARTYKWSGIACDDLVNLKRWRDALRTRPACERGVNVLSQK